MSEPQRMIPPATEQAWERLRRDVANHHANETSLLRDDHRDIERRVTKLEARLAIIEERMVAKLDALAASYGVMAEALDKLVTRTEFDTVRFVTYIMAGGVIVTAFAVIGRALFSL